MKTVLIIIPYKKIYPPMNGGMLRCFHLLHQLARYFEVTAIVHQDIESFKESFIPFPDLKKVKLFSTKDTAVRKDFFSVLPNRYQKALRYRWYNKSLKGPADENFLLMYPVVTEVLSRTKFDFIILENLSSLLLKKVIGKYAPKSHLIYDAHNVDYILALKDVEKKRMSFEQAERIKEAESSLAGSIDLVLACSDNDGKTFERLNNNAIKTIVVPNGVQVEKRSPHLNSIPAESQNILFCGSLDYEPNVQGIFWFIKDVWPMVQQQLPLLKLLIIGSGKPMGQLDPFKNDPSITFVGQVPQVGPYYEEAIISIVPLLTGSGTRLKILEAMSKRVPVISTSIGAEGIEYIHDENILIADDPKVFAKNICDLVRNKEKRMHIQQRGYELVTKLYDWDIIGEQLATYLKTNY
ncbi:MULTISPECIES: glycosyltransferase family 4 protein [Niastella]|uniref:Glycosyltransferase n=1 Tax=Niastella soli TaxID=2821487 RepID=A0ABS3YQJ7_9BACT|nr:glycosyltransferase family 4 protein [Niastella soli]MBO9200150.1 glycosyltransferase [Niastella soli]